MHEYEVNAQQASQRSSQRSADGASVCVKRNFAHKDNVFHLERMSNCSCPKAVGAAARIQDCWTVL